jgi:long-chain acyl-CoA synthetase
VGLRPECALDSEGLRAYCAENLVKYKVPAEIEIVDALPRTMVGKIDKKTLIAEAQQSAGQAVQ